MADANGFRTKAWRVSVCLVEKLFSSLLKIGTIILAVVALCQVHLQRNMMIEEHPPRLVVAEPHMWEKFKGRPEDVDNQLPSLEPGQVLEGTVFVVNVGPAKATIDKSNLTVVWKHDGISMINPGWALPKNHLSYFDTSSPAKNLIKTPEDANDIGLQGSERWEFDTQVPPARNESLYLFGHVDYRDPTGETHTLAFARKYDQVKARFVRVVEADDDPDIENEVPLGK